MEKGRPQANKSKGRCGLAGDGGRRAGRRVRLFDARTALSEARGKYPRDDDGRSIVQR